MRGVIAAGSPYTAEAGATALRAGGTAVDAALAATFASLVVEPGLTSAGGGGIMALHDGRRRETVICDFFPLAPGRGPFRPDPSRLDFFPLELDFGGTTQVFHVGRGTAAVPVVLPGLCEIHRAHGSLPLGTLLEPACRFGREGVIVPPFLEKAFALLEPILTFTPEARSVFAPAEILPRPGERMANPALAEILHRLGREGPSFLASGFMVDRLLQVFGPPCGQIGADDLREEPIIWRLPLALGYGPHRIETTPGPSQGGRHVATALRLVDALASGRRPVGSAEHFAACAHALRVAEATLLQAADPSEEALLAARDRFLESWDSRGFSSVRSARSRGPGNTTHLSVVDEAGNAASVTTTNGEGCGYMLPGTGIMLNNLMGEDDLNPGGFHRHAPGGHLPTMLAPAIVRTGDGSLIATGTGGSNRIRSAMLESLVFVLDHGMPPQEAVERARIHLDTTGCYYETHGLSQGVVADLARLHPRATVFGTPNMFFGGVHMAMLEGGTGRLLGGGDRRRSGTVVVVERA